MAIIEEAVRPAPRPDSALDAFRARIKALELNGRDESAAIVRADRDSRGQR